MTEIRVVAKVIVINKNGNVLLLRRSAGDVRRPLEWDIPGGHTDAGEFAEEAAARETLEEADLRIDPHALRLVYATSEVVQADLNVTWLFYIARLPGVPVISLSNEHAEYAWVKLDNVPEMLEYERQKKVFDYLLAHKVLV